MMLRAERNLGNWIRIAAVGWVMTGAPSAHAGAGGSGGGDPCQNRIEEIRNDIETWILASEKSTPEEKQGSAQLDFSKAHTDLNTYNQKMRDLIALTRVNGQTSISCTSNPNKVTIGGAEKLCKAHMASGRPVILCYRGKTQGDGKYIDGFLGASEEQQYFQVHHEFAVMAEFEDQTGDETNYPLSPQISAHLVDQVVKKLAIKPVAVVPPQPVNPLLRYAGNYVPNNHDMCPTELEVNGDDIVFSYYGTAASGARCSIPSAIFHCTGKNCLLATQPTDYYGYYVAGDTLMLLDDGNYLYVTAHGAQITKNFRQ